MSSGNAHIGKPAPNFSATAVVDGAFKEIKLSDYKGKKAAAASCSLVTLVLYIALSLNKDRM